MTSGKVAAARLPGLDLLPLAAVVLVLGRHFPLEPSTAPGGLRPVMESWQRGGWVGVDLFFVLSGFLVSGLLFSEYKSRGHISPLRFYVRRGWKIYPPFYALIATTVVMSLVFHLPLGRPGILAELLFVQSYWPGLWSHTWSLAVEEHFYLLLPLVLLALIKGARPGRSLVRPTLALAASIAVVSLGLRLLTWRLEPEYSHLRHVFATHLRVDSLFFGVAISVLYHFHRQRFMAMLRPWRWVLCVAGLALLSPAFVLQLEVTPFIYTGGFTLFYLGSGMLMVWMLLCELPRTPIVRLAAMLGARSYSTYLWHLPMAIWGLSAIRRLAGTLSFGATAALYIGGSFALGLAMAALVELPALRLRDRLFPARDMGALDAGAIVAP